MLPLLFCAVVFAPGNNPDLQRAHELHQGLEYKAALASVLDALKDPDLRDEERRDALALAGRLHAVLKKPVRARAYFLKLLHLDPNFAVSVEESPHIQKAFNEAREIVQRQARNSPPPVRKPERPAAPRATRTDDRNTTNHERRSPKPPAEKKQPFVRELPSDEETDDRDGFPWLVVGGSAAVAVAATVLLVVRPWKDEPGRASLGRWGLP